MIPLKDDNPSGTAPFVTVAIILANAAVYLYMLMLGPRGTEKFVLSYAAIPARLVGTEAAAPAEYMTVLSSMFMHGGFLHLAGNMLFLWVFGDNVEDRLGHLRFLLFYVLCGVAAALAHSLSHPGSLLPMIGASGAVSGVLGAYIVLFPRAGVWTFFFFLVFWQVIKVPAVLIIGWWIILQVINGLVYVDVPGGGVAWFAHVGGFLAGILLLLLMRKRVYRSNRHWRSV
ncbi:MAG TPA: rhomboid family intramembrane serine protease [Nitrospirota bacterium]|nr:rhomboid family intramembrane serine protease [Nitrospirota bacterium]